VKPANKDQACPASGQTRGRAGVWAELSQPDPWTVFLIALVAGPLLVWVVLFIPHWTLHFGTTTHAFTRTGQFKLWVGLLMLESGIWALALVPLCNFVRSHWQYRNSRSVGSVLAVLITLSAVLVGVTFGEPARRYPLPAHAAKLIAIQLVGFAVALVGVAAMALINSELRQVDAEELNTKLEVREAAAGLVRLRAEIQQLLLIEGVIIGAAVLATAGLRNAILAWSKHPNPPFPAGDVLAYGAAFSIVLALFWGPIFIRSNAVASSIRDRAMRGRDTDSPFLQWKQEQDGWGAYLGLQTSIVDSARNVIAILAPVLSAALGVLLKH
jgi:hypothetical protein